MDERPRRKLTTILSADVAGYSAMMERDEPGTLARLKESRTLMADAIAHFGGRIVSTAGDGLLAEFASVVDAVDCAVRIQRRLAEEHDALPESDRMRFRIGINLGDVMVDGGDLFGEGVNVAARLQALAEPGGILISGPVFDQVRNKLAVGFDFLGAQPVKNMTEPVAAWRVLLDGSGAGAPGAAPAPSERQDGPEKRRSGWGRLKRPAALAAIPIATVFLVNMFTSERIWFHWPTLGITIAFAVWAALTMGR